MLRGVTRAGTVKLSAIGLGEAGAVGYLARMTTHRDPARISLPRRDGPSVGSARQRRSPAIQDRGGRGSNQGNTPNQKYLYHQSSIDFRCYPEMSLFDPRRCFERHHQCGTIQRLGGWAACDMTSPDKCGRLKRTTARSSRSRDNHHAEAARVERVWGVPLSARSTARFEVLIGLP